MIVFTIGFTKKDARTFFETLTMNGIELLLDIRLNNKSQLAGFAKGRDLEYFMKKICKADYLHNTIYAPTKELLDGYKKGVVSWEEYVEVYNDLIQRRNVKKTFESEVSKEYKRVCLLCSEETPEKCHRRLLAEYLESQIEVVEQIIHL